QDQGVMVGLVCIDVDGTLVGASGNVPSNVWAATDRALAAGIRLAVCSGRPAFGVTRTFAERLDATGWHIFQNGASVVQLPSFASRSASVAPEAVARMIQRARSTGRVLELYTDTEYAVESSSERARQHAALLGVPFVARAFESLTGPVVRALWLCDQSDAEETLREEHPGLELGPASSPAMPDTVFINTTAAGVNKAVSVKTVAAAYGVSLDRVMFVGDGQNDIGAMEAVGLSVAMGNAAPEVRAIARYQVADVDEGGLVEALDLALRAYARGGDQASSRRTT
ncbi:MAG TPA: Cof-type HAD-IIB family hydrolase, partial [Gemmatimonadaceae bacterium]